MRRTCVENHVGLIIHLILCSRVWKLYTLPISTPEEISIQVKLHKWFTCFESTEVRSTNIQLWLQTSAKAFKSKRKFIGGSFSFLFVGIDKQWTNCDSDIIPFDSRVPGAKTHNTLKWLHNTSLFEEREVFKTSDTIRGSSCCKTSFVLKSRTCKCCWPVQTLANGRICDSSGYRIIN